MNLCKVLSLRVEVIRKENRQRKTFKTSDGSHISYISAGEGKPLVMLHVWSQSAEQFKYQIPAFAEHYRAIAEAIG